MAAAIPCPLCGSRRAMPLEVAHERRYRACDACRLTFMEPADRPDPEAERARYEAHENDPADARYRAFLDRLAAPLMERLTPGDQGLDYGSGSGPTLSVMLEEAGFRVALYDPFFAPGRAVLDRTYDFITCTETAEHFFAPGREFARLDALLRPGGWLGIMTQPREAESHLGDWWYARDPTHVCFYAPATMEWIAERFGWEMDRPAETVWLFRSRPSARSRSGGPLPS